MLGSASTYTFVLSGCPAHDAVNGHVAPVRQLPAASQATGSPLRQLVVIGRASTIVFDASSFHALPSFASPSFTTPTCWPQKFAMTAGTPATLPAALSTMGRPNCVTVLVALGKT